ncbi:ABC transporter substrate-binding protein [Ruania alba]|uniref:Carbohydrate ABC transporter substrate-binding protein, CUT1 family n=1 Tax=Ruania alba TaxID=648782 RepID=A0A1H5BUX4_9MICO|nr:extracellular solute-binding protein [Ruania alba]SED58195.1 carbohydrate ABC transporter substrate-binding protein, CUT1 family [Ruania alba]
MKRTWITFGAPALAGALALTACSSDAESSGGTENEAVEEITLSAWSVSITPEFNALIDAYNAQNPDTPVAIQEYNATEYSTQIIADLAADSAPHLITLKSLNDLITLHEGDQLLDVSDIAAENDPPIVGLDTYTIDDVTYAIPFRQDAWYLFYNKDLFDAAGIEYPDGSWTWDDYAAAAEELTEALDAAGSDAYGTFQQHWGDLVLAFANTQDPEADVLSGEWEYLVPWYERTLALQDAGAQVTYGSITTNSTDYKAVFGTQQTAMMPMGSWYVGVLLAQQESGDADDFAWGFAPAPQPNASTIESPVSPGSPTGIGINSGVSGPELDAARDFLAFVASEEAGVAVAEVGISPAYGSEAVTDAYFSVSEMPSDDLSSFAFAESAPRLGFPVDELTPSLQNILNDAHSAILAGTVSPADGIAEAMERAQSEVLG